MLCLKARHSLQSSEMLHALHGHWARHFLPQNKVSRRWRRKSNFPLPSKPLAPDHMQHAESCYFYTYFHLNSRQKQMYEIWRLHFNWVTSSLSMVYHALQASFRIMVSPDKVTFHCSWRIVFCVPLPSGNFLVYFRNQLHFNTYLNWFCGKTTIGFFPQQSKVSIDWTHFTLCCSCMSSFHSLTLLHPSFFDPSN